MKSKALLLLFLLAAPLRAQEVPLEVKGDTATVQVDRVVVVKEDRLLVRSLPFSVQAPAGGFGYQWDVPTGWQVTRKGRTLEVTAAPKGDAKVSVVYSVVDFDARKVEERYGSVAFAVGEVKPPDPPAPVTGLYVLVVEETADRSKLPVKQIGVLQGKTVRDWLDAHCKDRGIFDKDADLSAYSKTLQEMMRRPRQSLPWVVVRGDAGYLFEGPLPADVPAMMQLLGKYAPLKKKAG